MTMIVNPFVIRPPVVIGPHRYWRLAEMVSLDEGVWIGLNEVEMAESISGADVTSTAFLIKSSEPYVDSAVSNALDNNSATDWQWSTGSGPAGATGWLTYWWGQDFGAGNAKAIREVRMRPSQNIPGVVGRSPKSFKLQYSDNGTTWTTAMTVSGDTAWSKGFWNVYNDIGFRFAAQPTLSGDRALSSVLTANYTSVPSSGVSATYQWLRDGVAISGETAATYTTQVADKNHYISCQITLTYGSDTISGISASLYVQDVGPQLFNPPLAAYSGGWSRSGGNIVAASAANRVSQTGIFVSGQTYVVSFSGNKTSGQKLRVTTETSSRYVSPTIGNGQFTFYGEFVADGTQFRLEADGDVFTGTIPETSLEVRRKFS